MSKKNVLVVTREPETFLADGNNLIAHNLFKRIKNYNISLVCLATDYQEKKILENKHLPYKKIFFVKNSNTLPSITNNFLRVNFSNFKKKHETNKLESKVNNLIGKYKYDILHIREIETALLTAKIKHPAKVFEYIDSKVLYFSRELPKQPLKNLMRLALSYLSEKYVLPKFNITTVVSKKDEQSIKYRFHETNIKVIQNGVDCVYFRPISANKNGGPVLLFVGNMSHSPNVSAVKYFYINILPRIRNSYPKVKFIIVGPFVPKGIINLIKNDQSTITTGFVKDIKKYYQISDIFVLPMVSGSGIKNKLLEAMAMEKAIISTRLGIEALEVKSGKHLIVAKNSEDFSKATIELLNNKIKRTKLGKNARKFVLTNYSWNKMAKEYENLYNSFLRKL